MLRMTIFTFTGKQVINNAQEIIWPKLQAWWQNRKVGYLIIV